MVQFNQIRTLTIIKLKNKNFQDDNVKTLHYMMTMLLLSRNKLDKINNFVPKIIMC